MDNMMFAERRKKLLTQIDEGSILIIASRPALNCDGDNQQYQNSDFYYLTGYVETDAVLVLIPERKEGESIFFIPERDPTKELWFGKTTALDAVCTRYGFDQVYPIDLLEQKMPLFLADKEKVYFKIGDDPIFDSKILRWVDVVKKRQREGISCPFNFINLDSLLHKMRVQKNATEIAIMREAADITADAHLRAIKACGVGIREYVLEAEVLYEFIKRGGHDQAFETIVGGGPNSCTLHYCKNNETLIDGQLVLLDAGVRYQYYCADISRTFPVNGKFTKEQAAIYQAVLDTQLKVIDLIKPGVSWIDLQETAEKVITKHLVALEILRGDEFELWQSGAFKPFFPHRIGHFLGLDVHDVGVYRQGGEWCLLEKGMVFTVEPGIYISPSNNIDKNWWNIGVRIEDNILVTEVGFEVLTKKVPKTIAEIESIMLHKNAQY